ncbi:MAG: dihydrodipicolinate synthase family protein [Bacteroidales bacterium]|nr:dihydrodipicolinate synthase family protein [Bacteroidales bacterium]MCF8391297.1 dihydrodipicolinate synthase family protein [Bacteroidales bacterium]
MIDSKTSFSLEGIVPPLVTPLLSDNVLDVIGLEKLINHVINGGVHAIFILGTTGELSRLSYTLKKEVIQNSYRIINKRVPLLVGITDTSIQESFKLEKIAFDTGADAVVLAPPFYYHVEQQELLEYFKTVAENISLPLFLYNMPARTHISIDIETARQASEIPGIVGIKDSSGDFDYFKKLLEALKDKPNFSVFVGPEEIMAQSVLLGASGGVNGGANLFPELYVQLYEAARTGDLETVANLQGVVDQISSNLYQVGKGHGQPNFIKILKEALCQKGICKAIMEKPYIPFSTDQKQQISIFLNNIEVPDTLKKLERYE